ncbi:uncharacterized protein LOC116112594 [Pistacia vera]|uniref:uncharacterized protein LOC116112594 n=1 Tax=Pistacia vera TaxID=55513 RepID=UPI001262B597|nr:uncharacterized protein LOC116112594 [Pistacia vera]
MANRVKRVLPQFVNKAQGAFVGGRKIVDNILLSQELLHHYDKKSAKGARCAMKVDLMKAYDSVRRDFVIKALELLRFPLKFIGWVEKCIKTPKYSVAVNGELSGFFSGGLRQGDPISPFLFLIAMERALDCFKFWAGLEANPSKSNIFFSGVSEEGKQALLPILGYQEGKLPMKYLGVPLITKKLSPSDCKPLVYKILARIQSWRSKFLSYAGRSGSDMKTSKAKVAWEEVCVPVEEGGLGIMRAKDLNKAAMMRHVWNLNQVNSGFGWVEWIKATYLVRKSFWEIPIPSDASWAWRSILKLRMEAREHIKVIIENGQATYVWRYNWHLRGPLKDRCGSHIVYDSGLQHLAKVCEI